MCICACVAIGLLVMMYPILCKVRYETLHEVFSHRGIWKQMAFSVFMNWIIAPFLMVCMHVAVVSPSALGLATTK